MRRARLATERRNASLGSPRAFRSKANSTISQPESGKESMPGAAISLRNHKRGLKRTPCSGLAEVTRQR